MGTDKGSPDFDATKAELFEAISHPARIKILQTLSEKPMGFAQLGRAVGIESGGHLSFHLNKLRHLVQVGPDGNYALTADGKEALWSVNALRKATGAVPAKGGESTLRHRSFLKPTLAIIVVAIVVLGGIGIFEQGEYASQQQQLSSQQKVIGILQNGLPFTNGQGASLVIGQAGFGTYGAGTTQEKLNNPTDVAFDSSGDMWVSEFSNDRVIEFKPPFSFGMSASVVIGQKVFTTATPAVTRAGLGQNCGSYGPCGPNAIAVDSSGDLWVDDYGANRILEYEPPFSNGMNASVVIGQKDFTSEGCCYDHLAPAGSLGPASANSLLSPNALAFDSFGNLWVTDGDHNRVLEFKPPFSNGMNASIVLGQENFTNDAASDGLNGLSCKFGYVAIDRQGDVWVGDTQNDRIVEFRPPFRNGMNASLVLDQNNLVIDSQPFPYASGNLGWVISFDTGGNLWASSNDRFLVFRPPFTAGVRSFPVLEIGQPNFTSTVLTGGESGFGSSGGAPSGVGFDSSGNLWVADSSNNRVLEFVAGSMSQSNPNTGFPPNSWQFQLVTVGTALLVGGTLVALFRRRVSRRATWFPS
jgi:sugar lactone lactonase YvrE